MTEKQKVKVAVIVWLAFGLILLFMFIACGPVDEIPATKTTETMASLRPSIDD